MKKTLFILIKCIISLLFVPICKFCGEFTNEPFAYGIIWSMITDLIFTINIKVVEKTDDKSTK